MAELKVMSVFGTRPEAIKMAPVVAELSANPAISSSVMVTAQHREMLDQVLGHFRIVPDYDLDIMRESQTLSHITGRVLEGAVRVFAEARPDIVLVHGDTSTTFAAALGAFYERIPVGHVEAGLRTGNKYSPFPEEMNRHLTAVIADLHFAPTGVARDNLLAEGVPRDRIRVTGNTAIDALLRTVRSHHTFVTPELQGVDFQRRRVLAVEAHRRENWGRPLEEVCLALSAIVRDNPDVLLIYSVHRNPEVAGVVERVLGGCDRVILLAPLPYVEWAHLMVRSYLVITDSGGLQEEAPSLGKPVVLLRDTTERPEAVEAGTVWQVGTDRAAIIAAVSQLLTDPAAYEKMARAINPYGDGRAAERIVQTILWRTGLRVEPPAEFGL